LQGFLPRRHVGAIPRGVTKNNILQYGKPRSSKIYFQRK